MSAKDASIFAWAYGMLGLRPDRVIQALTREGLATVGEATPHDLSNLAWGLARAGLAEGGGDDFEDEGEGDGEAKPGGEEGRGVVEGQRRGVGAQGEEGTEEGEEARMQEEDDVRSRGRGRDAGGRGGRGGGEGLWRLGWMRGKQRGRRWRRDHEHQAEGEEEEGAEGEEEEGEQEGGFLGVEVSTTSGGAADGGIGPAADLVDPAPPGRDAEVSVEQRLGEALLARASER